MRIGVDWLHETRPCTWLVGGGAWLLTMHLVSSLSTLIPGVPGDLCRAYSYYHH